MSVDSMIIPSAPPSASAPSETAMPGPAAKPTRKHFRLPRVNWHEAASCALQIELKDYAQYLEYAAEYILGRNSYRIDLLIIKKLSDIIIPRDIARIFRSFNLFEIKGLGSSVTTDTYYKTIGYAGLLISQTGNRSQYSALDISLSFLSLHYPRRLIRHLTKERKITVAKVSPGVYHINKETFIAQIIVTSELSDTDFLYLRCLTGSLQDDSLARHLVDDFEAHQKDEIYIRYMHQINTANLKQGKGDLPMVSEGTMKICEMISDYLISRTQDEDEAYYQPQINALASQNSTLTSQNNTLALQNNTLTMQVDYLKSLLRQHDIPFDADGKDDPVG